MNKDIEILAKRKIAADDTRLAEEFRKELSDTKLELANRGWGADSGMGVARIHAVGRRNTRLRAESVYQRYKEAFEAAGVPLTEQVLRECADQALPYYENAAKNIGEFVRRQCLGINDLDRMLAPLDQEVERDRHEFSNHIEIECTAARLKAKNRGPTNWYDRINQGWKNNKLIVVLVIAFGIVVALAAGFTTIRNAIAPVMPFRTVAP